MFNEGNLAGDDDDDASGHIRLPFVNRSATNHHEQRGRFFFSKTPSTSSQSSSSAGLLDRLTKDVVDMYSEMTAQGPATSAERADLHLTQQLEGMERTADEMLEKLAEYCELLELLRNSTSVTLNQQLPKTFETIQQMHEIYRRIDQIEDVVRTAEGLTDGMENAVTRAENELTPKTSAVIKGFLRKMSPFVLPKSRDVSGWEHLEYYEAPVFSLESLRPSSPKTSKSDASDTKIAKEESSTEG
ncbi:hypothetical protein BV898_00692 [Hypsibius exemplaris]|uniref:Biogenesis of lysosome-related organelles complex 1 subunit 4 n=1 Tax=Hypsibius exemplaris TaxID=2072580 RepID=A0A1W0XE71_HYPEX|nr:hypothetical protein BV898_00692 [Hypsibius exemplaris]